MVVEILLGVIIFIQIESLRQIMNENFCRQKLLTHVRSNYLFNAKV